MKLTLIFLLFPAVCFSQPLNDIITKRQAEQLIASKFRYYQVKYDSFAIEPSNPHFDSFGKADFNGDGLEDLLAFGIAHVTVKDRSYEEDEIVILVGEKKGSRKVDFPYPFFRGLGIHIVPYPKIISLNDRDFIQLQYEIINYDDRTFNTFYDTVFVKANRLIPYNISPSEKLVSKIEFKTDHCYGTCPVFEISIDEKLDANYNGVDHVDKKGEFKLKASKEDWDYLTKLISFLRIEDLGDSYSVNWTDDQTAYLTVHFRDGSKKQIEDYGLKGSFGLSILYDYFFELRKF